MRSFGMGGGIRLLRGLRLLYQGFFVRGSSSGGPTVMEDLVVVVVRVLSAKGRSCFPVGLEELSLSETTDCKGSVATGSDVLVELTPPTGSVEVYSFSWPRLSAIFSILLWK